jgi:poly-gamma-glutamate synthesis protein (capsule biosynthesis protein)
MNHDANLAAAQTDDGYDFSPFFAQIAPSLQQADLVLGNLEMTLGEPPYTGYPQFCSPYDYLDDVTGAGFDVLTLANNHMMDRRREGIESTVAALKQRNIPHTGAFASQEDAEATLVVDVEGIKIAVLAYTSSTNGIPLPADMPYAVNLLDTSDVDQDVQKARAEGADVVVAAVHWGEEYVTTPSSTQKNWAQTLAEAGVDIVLGSHPHVVQPAEWLVATREDGTEHRTFVAYSMGNFISNQSEWPRCVGVMFDFSIQKNLETGETTLGDVGYIPTYVLRADIDGKRTYAVLPAGKFMNEEVELPGLTAGKRGEVARAWSEVTDMLGDSGLTALAE